MADFTALKTAIQNAIKQNGNEEITGNILQDVLLAIVSTLGDGSINDLITALGSEATTRGQADTTLQQNIDAEATTRGQADTALGGRIDGVIESINAINAAIGNGYVYAGIATPSSTPATGKVFYLALTAGTYTNFGNIAVTQGINILKNNGSTWSLDSFLGIDDAPTPSSNKLVKSDGVFNDIMTNGSAFDLTAYNNGTTYADLNAALTALNALPAAYKKGGMSMKYVHTSDNKYVQYRCITQSFSVHPEDWQSIDSAIAEIKSDYINIIGKQCGDIDRFINIGPNVLPDTSNDKNGAFDGNGGWSYNENFCYTNFFPIESVAIYFAAYGTAKNIYMAYYYDREFNYIGKSLEWVNNVTPPISCRWMRICYGASLQGHLIAIQSSSFTDGTRAYGADSVLSISDYCIRGENLIGYLDDNGKVGYHPGYQVSDYIDSTKAYLLYVDIDDKFFLATYNENKELIGMSYPQTHQGRYWKAAGSGSEAFFRVACASNRKLFIIPLDAAYEKFDLNKALKKERPSDLFINNHIYENLLTKYGYATGMVLVNDRWGVWFNSGVPSVVTSGYIPITESGISVYAKADTDIWYFFYDDKKDAIEGTYGYKKLTANSVANLTIPSGASYVKISGYPSIINVQRNISNIKSAVESDDFLYKNEYIRIGTASDLLNAMNKGGKYYIESGEYDIQDALGNDYLNSFTNQEFGPYMNDGEYIFAPNAVVKFDYTGDNQAVIEAFAPINPRGKNVKIVGLNLHASNCKFPIHDELGGAMETYLHEFLNCKIEYDNCFGCIGGGLGYNGNIIIDGCIFDGENRRDFYDADVIYHNDYREGAKSTITIKNCIDIPSDSTFRFGYYGASTAITDVIVTNCNLSRAPYVTNQTGDAQNVNMRLYAWNNNIRND